MRFFQIPLALRIALIASPTLMFWKRGGSDEQRMAVFDDLYDTIASVYETTAGLKDEWTDMWLERHQLELPPRFQKEEVLPERTLVAIREVRFGRSLLQRYRWRSVRQPLFEEIQPVAWAALQRRMQIVTGDLLTIEQHRRDFIREDEVDWIERAIEGYDHARAYLRSAERQGEPIERQVANSAYMTLHQSVQLSDRLIARQRFELTDGD